MSENRAPVWFYTLAGVALIWNLIGALAVGFDLMLTADDIAMLPENQQQLYANRPQWAVWASISAVGFGAIGCLGLLLKQRWAGLCFVLSICGLVLQDIAIFFIMDGLALAGTGPLIMQILVFLIAVGLYYLSIVASRNGWIR